MHGRGSMTDSDAAACVCSACHEGISTTREWCNHSPSELVGVTRTSRRSRGTRRGPGPHPR